METFAVRGRLLIAGRLRPGAVVVASGRIAEVITDPAAAATLPATTFDASIVSPGLIDLQMNGGFGLEVGADAEAIRQLAARLPATGVTAFLPTLTSSWPDAYRATYAAFAAAARDTFGAAPLGLHLEGPFLAPDCAGAHSRQVIESARPDLLDQLLEGDALRLVTLAPERRGALQMIERLRRRGVVVSLGHTAATLDEMRQAVDAGATLVTHLFNAMSPFQHRAPGAVGAALVDDRVVASVIADGVHCHPAALQLALRAKSADRLLLVTDAVAAAGMDAGRYQLGGQTIVADATAARLEDGTLAGSLLTLDQAVRNMITLAGASPAQALNMASEVPARVLGLTNRGRIERGYVADLVLWNSVLQVVDTFAAGRRFQPSTTST